MSPRPDSVPRSIFVSVELERAEVRELFRDREVDAALGGGNAGRIEPRLHLRRVTSAKIARAHNGSAGMEEKGQEKGYAPSFHAKPLRPVFRDVQIFLAEISGRRRASHQSVGRLLWSPTFSHRFERPPCSRRSECFRLNATEPIGRAVSVVDASFFVLPY